MLLLRAELYAEGLGFRVEVVELVAGAGGLLGFGGRLDNFGEVLGFFPRRL